ncbi:MAG TPA: hypothetical protein PKW07_10910 [Syntrophorhabdaceae bacterium]|nr:hypothetical protein [Syntrophorhabdaceae bacterium]
MKSLDKFKKQSGDVVSKKSESAFEIILSHSNATRIVAEAIKQTENCIESLMSYLSERERTKQVYAETTARIIESKNRLNQVREIEATKRLEISLKSLYELEKLDNEKEKIRLLKGCIQQAIITMNESKLIYNETANKELIDKIHEQNLRLLEVSKTISALR